MVVMRLKKAFTKAVQVAIRNKAELVIVNIIDSRAFQGISGFENVIADDTLKSAKEFVDRYEKIAHDAGVENTKTRIEFGSPKVLLSDTVPREEGVDLIMVGSTGLTAIERLLIGSVAEYIIRNAPCDVLVVR